MNKPVTLLLKTVGAFVLGCVVALSLMQNDPWLKSRIEQYMRTSVSDLIGELISVRVDQIDLLRGELVMKDTSVACPEGSWSFACPTIRMHVSLLSWFKGNGFDTTVTMEKPTLSSKYEQGAFAVEKPFYALINAPLTIPLTVVRCDSQGATVTLTAPMGDITARCSSVTTIDAQQALTKVICADGYALKGNDLFAQHLLGNVVVEVPQDGKPYTLSMKLTCTRPSGRASSKDLPYQFYYRFSDGLGTCKFRAEDGSCSLQADDIVTGQDQTTGMVTLSGHVGELASFVVNEPAALKATGTGIFSGTVHVSDTGYAYHGDAQMCDVVYGGVTVDSAKLSLAGDDKTVNAHVLDAESCSMGLKGSLTAHLIPGELSGRISLSRPYEGTSQCIFEKGHAQLQYKNNTLTADIKGKGLFFGGSKMPLKASVTTDFKTAQAKGTFGGNIIDFACEVKPFLINQLMIRDPLRNKRLELQVAEGGGALEGMIDGLLIKKLLHAITGYQLTGAAQAQVKTLQTKDGPRVDLSITDASLKIPGTYTVIKELSGVIDLNSTNRCVIVHDLSVTLHKGTAWSSRAAFYFDEAGSLYSAHVPLQCKGLLLSKQKELFGTISGGVTLVYADGHWQCKGLMTIENAHLRSNLLSSEVQKELMPAMRVSPALKKVHLDMRVQTRTPLKVKTSFLEGDAHLDMHIQGTAAKPELSGDIELGHGQFNFPYKPLFVTAGKIVLAPQQPDGPTIFLTAKNKIRSYAITMRVTGTLQQPNVTFESSPHLPEEGIITLLLSGSDHGSLSAVMPRVLMEQIEDSLFGSEEQLSAAQQFLKGLLTPLKNVHLVKNDADQDELQAVLEVDINERLRAKAQNNLKLSDETQLELEYVVSDDMTVKAVRDQAGSLGGEVEMRWKF